MQDGLLSSCPRRTRSVRAAPHAGHELPRGCSSPSPPCTCTIRSSTPAALCHGRMLRLSADELRLTRRSHTGPPRRQTPRVRSARGRSATWPVCHVAGSCRRVRSNHVSGLPMSHLPRVRSATSSIRITCGARAASDAPSRVTDSFLHFVFVFGRSLVSPRVRGPRAHTSDFRKRRLWPCASRGVTVGRVQSARATLGGCLLTGSTRSYLSQNISDPLYCRSVSSRRASSTAPQHGQALGRGLSSCPAATTAACHRHSLPHRRGRPSPWLVVEHAPRHAAVWASRLGPLRSWGQLGVDGR